MDSGDYGMTLTLKITALFILFGIIIVLTACGGSSGSNSGVTYTGIKTAATINDTNAKIIGTSSTEAAVKSILNANARQAIPFIPGPSSFSLSDNTSRSLERSITVIAKKAVAEMQTQNLPAGITLNASMFGPDYCGGSISVPDNYRQMSTLNGTMTLDNLCYDDGFNGKIVLNGQVIFAETGTTITITYSNFTVVFGGQTQTINATLSCDLIEIDCTFTSDYVGDDGKTYRISGFYISGNETTGYIIGATFFHPDQGSVTISTSNPVTFNSSGNPISGTLDFASGTSTGSITFNSDGLGYTGSWSDGGTGGSFSGTW